MIRYCGPLIHVHNNTSSGVRSVLFSAPLAPYSAQVAGITKINSALVSYSVLSTSYSLNVSRR